MTVQNNPSAGPVQPNSARSDEAEQARQASQADGAKGTDAPPDEAAPGDRVEISDAARAAQSDAAGDAALVQRAREALSTSSLSADRLSELRANAESGRYTEPDAVQQAAEGLADDLGSPPSES